MTQTPSSIEQLFAQVLYFSSTESMIPWEWLQESRDKRFLMTERERVDMLLGAVNGESFTVREWSRLCGAPLLEEGSALVIKKDGKIPTDVAIPLFAQAAIALRSALAGLIDEAEAAVPTVAKNLREILRLRVLTIPDESTLGVPRDRVIAHSPGAALAYSLRLVLDAGKPFRRLLRQCTFSDCGRFALGKPPSTRGKPRDYFCSEEHETEHSRKQGRERKRKQRSRSK